MCVIVLYITFKFISHKHLYSTGFAPATVVQEQCSQPLNRRWWEPSGPQLTGEPIKALYKANTVVKIGNKPLNQFCFLVARLSKSNMAVQVNTMLYIWQARTPLFAVFRISRNTILTPKILSDPKAHKSYSDRPSQLPMHRLYIIYSPNFELRQTLQMHVKLVGVSGLYNRL